LTFFRIAKILPQFGDASGSKPTVSTDEPDDRDYVQSLAKGLAVIECFGTEPFAMTLSEVARRVDLTPGSARRMLKTLERLGYVGFERGRYALLPRALGLGYAYLASLPLATLVQPRLTQLTRDLDESCSLAMLDRHDVVIVARATARRLPADYMVVGSRLPAHATSFGKVLLAQFPPEKAAAFIAEIPLQRLTPNTICDPAALLAELSAVRGAGWAMNRQESILGLRSVAVPVRSNGVVVAALGTSAEASAEDSDAVLARCLGPLRLAAESLSHGILVPPLPGATIASNDYAR
jgi:IclR family pca regulon transcriptional regulator